MRSQPETSLPFDSMRIEIITAQHTAVSSQWANCPLHTDVYSRLYLVDDGAGELEYRNRRIRLSPGNMYLIPARQPFRNIDSPGLSHYWIHFTARLVAGIEVFDTLECPHEIPIENPAETGEMARRLVEIERSEPPGKTPSQILESQALIRLLLLPFITVSRRTGSIRYDGARRFIPVLEFIDRHIDDELRVENMAGLLNVHPNYFSGRFSRIMGLPPMEYVLRKRIERSQILLWTTDLPLKEIAAQVGYGDPAYFSRLFKKRTGVTPGTYRKRRRILSTD
jgi:AraC-like DNA-binding protein